jgi:hypothetical protein
MWVKATLRSAMWTFAATYQSQVALQYGQCMAAFTHDIVEIMGFTKGTSTTYQEADKTGTTAGDKSSGIPNREYAYTPQQVIAQYPVLANINMLFGGESQPSSFNSGYPYGYGNGHGTSALDVEAFTACFGSHVSHLGALYIGDGNMLNKAGVTDSKWFEPVLG